MSVNQVVVNGNLTRDPELRRTSSGTAILAFGIAVNDRRKNPSTGEWDDRADFFDCTLFGPRAESLSEILVKGLKVSVSGRLRQNRWEKDGKNFSKVDIVVGEIDFLSPKSDRTAAEPEASSKSKPSTSGAYEVPEFEEVEDVYE